MKLNDKIVDNENDILAMLDKVASGEEEFAVLSRSPKRFIQTSGNMLEYNSGQKLYSTENVSNEDIKAAFLSYYRGDDKYKKFFRKTSAKAEKETVSDILLQTWHDFLDICIFTTLRFSEDRIRCKIALSSWIFYGMFVFAGVFLWAVYPQSDPDNPALWFGGGAFLFLIGIIVLLGNLCRKRAKIENGVFYPDADYCKEPFPISEIKCIWIRKDNMHCQLGVLHKGNFRLLATYSSGLALKHGRRLSELLGKPLKFGDQYRKIAKSQILITALILPFLFFFLYGYENTILKLQRVAASKNWIKASATVVKSELQLRYAKSAYSRTPIQPHQRKAVRISYQKKDNKEAYLLCFEYQFKYNDRTIVGSDYSFFTNTPTNSGLKYLQKTVDDNPVGKEIFCYVNPENPTLNVVNRAILWVYFLPYLIMLFVGILLGIAVFKRFSELIIGLKYRNISKSSTPACGFAKNKQWRCQDSRYRSHRLVFSDKRIIVRPTWIRAAVFCGWGATMGFICSLILCSELRMPQFDYRLFFGISLLFVCGLLSYLFLRSYPEIDLEKGIFYPCGKKKRILGKNQEGIPLKDVSAIDLSHHTFRSENNFFECFTLQLIVPHGRRNYHYMLLNHGDYSTFMHDAEKLSQPLGLPLPDAGLEDFNSQWIRRYSYIALLVYPVFIFIAGGGIIITIQSKDMVQFVISLLFLICIMFPLLEIVKAFKDRKN